MLKKIIREPLFHFLILGAGIFLLAGTGDSRSQGSDKIIVTAGQIEQLVVAFARTWQRPPTEKELKGLIDDHIKEEVSYREALSLGLDRDDTIVRRRMRQKLEFLVSDPPTQDGLPADQELQTYLDQHADKYRPEPQLAFEQVYFSSDRRGNSAEADAKLVLTQLAGRNISSAKLYAAGDPSLLPVELGLSSQSEIARLFGEKFGTGLAEIEPGRWAGPIDSNYGTHLVLVRERLTGRVPELSEVRADVLRDLLSDRRGQLLDGLYNTLMQRHTVIIESPRGEVGGKDGSGGGK